MTNLLGNGGDLLVGAHAAGGGALLALDVDHALGEELALARDLEAALALAHGLDEVGDELLLGGRVGRAEVVAEDEALGGDLLNDLAVWGEMS